MGIFSNLFKRKKENFKEIMENGAKIIDVRTPSEFSKGNLKGSVNIPLDQLLSNIEKIKSFKSEIIVCCASGMRSSAAKSILLKNGIKNVHNGGSWSSLNYLN